MTISFSIRGNVIQARLTDGASTSLRLSTGIKAPSNIKFQKGQFIGSTSIASRLNHNLNKHRVNITDLYTLYGDTSKVKNYYKPECEVEHILNKESYDLLDLTNHYLQMAISREVKTKSGKPYEASTIKKFATTMRVLSDFSKTRGRIDLMELSINPKDDLRKKREVTERWNRYFNAFEDYMVNADYRPSTRSQILIFLSVVINYWKSNLYLQLPKLNISVADKNPILALEPSFVKSFLMDEETYSKLNNNLKFTWEICATILITTMRVSDALNMTVNDLRITNDAIFLSKMNGKTREYTDVPIPNFLAKIYRQNLEKYGRIYTLDKDYYVVYRNLSNLFSLFPAMHEIVSVKTFNANGEEVTEVGPMHGFIHPHMLRKTAITTMIFYKVSERHIKFCSGHSANSVAFERYVAFVDKHFKSEVMTYYKEFLND